MANTLTPPVPVREVVRSVPMVQVFSRRVTLSASPANVRRFIFDIYPGVVDRSQLNGVTAANGNPLQAQTTYVGVYPGPFLDLWFNPTVAMALTVEEALHWVGTSSGTVLWNRTYGIQGMPETPNCDTIRLRGTRLRLSVGGLSGVVAGQTFDLVATFRME